VTGKVHKKFYAICKPFLDDVYGDIKDTKMTPAGIWARVLPALSSLLAKHVSSVSGRAVGRYSYVVRFECLEGRQENSEHILIQVRDRSCRSAPHAAGQRSRLGLQLRPQQYCFSGGAHSVSSGGSAEDLEDLI